MLAWKVIYDLFVSYVLSAGTRQQAALSEILKLGGTTGMYKLKLI